MVLPVVLVRMETPSWTAQDSIETIMVYMYMYMDIKLFYTAKRSMCIPKFLKVCNRKRQHAMAKFIIVYSLEQLAVHSIGYYAPQNQVSVVEHCP